MGKKRRTDYRKRIIVVGLVIVLIVGLMIGSYFLFRSPWKYRGEGPIRILHVASYSEDFEWTVDGHRGFMNAIDEYGMNVEMRVFYMDTKIKDSEEEKVASGEEAKRLIDEWEPDLIYVTDDNAQKYVMGDYVGSRTPIVFSGVNGEPEDYGYVGAKNVAGILERDPFEFTINSIKELYPYAKRVAAISDSTTTGRVVFGWMKEEAKKFPELEFVAFDYVDDFEQYKEKILSYQDDVDIVLLRGFNFIDDSSEFYRWTIEHSDIPEISFGSSFAFEGGLLSVSLSGEEQGRAAGEIAKKILVEGSDPSSIAFEFPKGGMRHINLARAKTLDLEIPSIILINSEVIEEFPWEDGE